jgi:hypothetical protein
MLAVRAMRAEDSCFDYTRTEGTNNARVATLTTIERSEMNTATWKGARTEKMILAGLEPAIFGSEDQRLIH